MSQSTTRNAPTAVIVALAVLGLIFAVAAVLYLTKTAGALPSFLPGHQAGSTHHHTKHGVVALGLAVLSLAGAWLLSGKRATTPASTT
jgi:hypothetical protein